MRGEHIVYHVVANLEERFRTAEEALEFYRRPVQPYIPMSRMKRENGSIPRICVAETVENCLMGIGLLGRFRRCLGGNEGAYSYACKGREVYPILIVEFSPDEHYHLPSLKEVPDADGTGEWWLTHAAIPISVSLVWLDMSSIEWHSEDMPDICKSVRWHDTPPAWGNHPWLNGKGHPLESSEPEEYD